MASSEHGWSQCQWVPRSSQKMLTRGSLGQGSGAPGGPFHAGRHLGRARGSSGLRRTLVDGPKWRIGTVTVTFYFFFLFIFLLFSFCF
jgi:hypothetical protein